MAAKVTLYVRDDELWRRVRERSGPGGLSAFVHECLRHELARGDSAVSPPSLLERARKLREEADALVRAVEADTKPPHRSRNRQSRS